MQKYTFLHIAFALSAPCPPLHNEYVTGVAMHFVNAGLHPSSLVSLARQEDRQKQTGFRRNFAALTMFFCGLRPSSLVSLARQEDCMSFQQKIRL
jgi:hypothetical protein